MVKRALDVALSGMALLALLPLFVLIAVAVRLDSAGPALYRQRRVGRYGAPFTLYKFRSMRVQKRGDVGPLITSAGDSRITRVGSWLRRSKLDELPQLWNVLRGDMSLVGPRPEVPMYVATYTPEQRSVLDYRPGVTCVSSLDMYDEESILAGCDDPERMYRERILPRKIELAVGYAKNASVVSDLEVIAQTARRVVSGGAETRRLTRSAG